jgi:hypothetical protein
MRRQVEAHRIGRALSPRFVRALLTNPLLVFCELVPHLPSQKLVSIDCDGQFCEDGEAKENPPITTEGSTNKLFFKSICQRVKPADQPPPPPPAHDTVKPLRFPQKCCFTVVLQPPIDFIGSHVRICSDTPLLRIGTEFQICCEDASDCFGKVVACSSTATSVYTLDVEVLRHVKYLTCSPQRVGTILSEVFHVFFEKSSETKSPQLVAEIARRTAAAAANLDADCAVARQRIAAAISAQKTRAKDLASRPVGIFMDQLNMVMLRRCFLLVKPLICDVVRRLIEQWMPCNFDLKVPSSSDGHWDLYAIVTFLLRPKIIVLLNRSFACDTADQEFKRQRLESILKIILSVRNWWAHVNVSINNFREALFALQDFIAMVPQSLRVVDCDSVSKELGQMLATLNFSSQELPHKMNIDEIAYFYFGQACTFLTELSNHIMNSRPLLMFSSLLKKQMLKKKDAFRQKRVVEVKDVTGALTDLNSQARDEAEMSKEGESARFGNLSEFRNFDFHFECKTIDIVRNSFAHLSRSGNVIMVVLALGSLSHMFSFLRDMIASDTSPDETKLMELIAQRHKTIEEWQAELLGKTDMVDASVLIECIYKSNRDQLDQCEYASLATNNYQRLRLLTTSEVIISQQAPFHRINHTGETGQRIRSMLHFISFVPNSARESARSAVRWLMRSTSVMHNRTKNQSWFSQCIAHGLQDQAHERRDVDVEQAFKFIQNLSEPEFTSVTDKMAR